MTPLSDHFTLEELTRSSIATQYGLDNTPEAETVEHLRRSAQLLEAVRAALEDRPIRITSGYRSAAVNKAVGGAATSAHRSGWAIDLQCPEFGSPYDVCQRILAKGIHFDQLIHEYGRWTHISFDPRMRREPLSIARVSQGYLKGILQIPQLG